MRNLVGIIFFIGLFVGCRSERIQENMIRQDFDISPNDQFIAYSFCDSLGCAIYEFSLADSSSQRVTNKDELNYFYPRYSPNGKEILFLANTVEKGNLQRIYVFEKDTRKTSIIETESLYVTEAAYSKSGDAIIFIAATLYKNASLQSSPSFSYDIYQYKNGSINQVTTLKARSITGIAVAKSDSVYSNIQSFDKQYYGLYKVSLSDKNVPLQIRLYFLKGNEIGYNFLFNPALSANDSNLIITSSRIITEVDLNTMKSKHIYSAKESFIYSPRYFHFTDRIAFTKDSAYINEKNKEIIERGVFSMSLQERLNINKIHLRYSVQN